MLYKVVFVSAIQQCESAVSIHMSPPSWASHPSRLSLTKLSSFVLYSNFPLAICFTSDQISHSFVSDSLRLHESQHARPPCPSPTPGVAEGCLFTFLIVSFVVQKLLSLFRSHLFIFAFISNICGKWVIEDPAVVYVGECFAYVLL